VILARGFFGGCCSGVCVFSSGFVEVSVAIAMASLEAVEVFFLAFRGGIANSVLWYMCPVYVSVLE